MKSLFNKFASNPSRFEFLYLFIPFILWIFCFRHFFTDQLHLEADAISYGDHIMYYTNNLSKGVFPLWDPQWYGGAPYHFFLRRIGDVNPFLFLVILLKWSGVPILKAYLIYVGIYYFLAAWGLYLITRFLLVDRFFGFMAYTLFLFSSWGSEVFYNYIIIVFVPIVWFFYFLLSFYRMPQKRYLLGLCLCVGLIITTYIPFFFLTIFMIFSFFFTLFYGKELASLIKKSLLFFQKNKFFTLFCILFLLISSIPGLIFYKESKGGEFVLPNRHSGGDVSSAVTVGLDNVASGDIISHGYFDRVFDDHADMDMGDIYLPYIFFLILLVTFCAKANKLIFFLLFNILALSLITITSAAGVHKFLYEHAIIFKFIRNIYYFFWLAILPMAILLSVTALKALLSSIEVSTKKLNWLIYILACHLIFILFLLQHPGVLWGAWASVLISILFFISLFIFEKKISYLTGFLLILLAVFIQSWQVYDCLDRKVLKEQRENALLWQMKDNTIKTKLNLYYSATWFASLVTYLDPQVLDNYRSHRFIFYDNVVPYADSPQFLKTLESTLSSNENVAFVSSLESNARDWKINDNAISKADFNPIDSGKLTVSYSDANTWVLKTHLAYSQFLVLNDSYNSAWHVYINGRQVHLFRANVAFKGVWIPAGDSNVVFRFLTPKRYLFHFFMILLFTLTFVYLITLFISHRHKKTNG